MADKVSITELILSAKDEASDALNRVRGAMEKVNETSLNMNSIFSSFKGILAGVAGALGAAGLGLSLKSTVDSTEELSSEISKLQRITGMSAESASELIAVAHHVGVGFDTLQSAIIMVERRMGGLKGIEDMVTDASGSLVDVFERFGIQVKNTDGTTKSFSEVFEQLRQRIRGAKDQTEQMTIATQFFGKNSAAQILPLLTMSAERFKELAEEAKKYGLIMTQDNIDSVRKYTLAHRTLDEAMLGLKLTIGQEVIPALTHYLKIIAEGTGNVIQFAKAHKDELVSSINETKEAFKNVAIFSAGIFGAAALGGGFGTLLSLLGPIQTFLMGLSASMAGVAAATALTIPQLAGLALILGTVSYVGYKTGTVIDDLVYKLSGLDLSGLNKPMENIAQAQASISKNSEILNKELEKLGFVGPDAWNKFNDAVKAGKLVYDENTKSYRDMEKERLIAEENQKKAAELNLAMEEHRLRTLEANKAYEKALLDKAYSEGIISVQEYYAKLEKLDKEYLQRQLKVLDDKIAAAKGAQNVDLKLIDDLEQQKIQLNLKYSTERVKAEEDVNKQIAKGQEEAAKTAQQQQENSFNNWKNLQELKIQSLASQLNLQNAMEETAANQGLMRQSELLANQLDRYIQISNAKIIKAEEIMNELTRIGKTESDEYQKAAAEREQLQNNLQAKIIESEAQISEQKKNEASEAEKFIADLLQDRFRQDEVSRKEQLAKLETFYQQGRITAEDYYKGLAALDKQYTSEFEREIKERTEQLNQIVQVINDRTQKMWQSIRGFFAGGFDDVKQYYRDLQQALTIDIEGVEKQISSFLRQVNSLSVNTFWNASLFGRRMVDMVGTSVYEWAQRVTEYIQYVKQLMASLQDTISSYRMQLLQLRGDRLGELEMWLKEEKKKLEDKYKDDLKNTKEYYEAMALLDEFYKEKKKKILDDMQSDAERAKEENQSQDGTSSGGSVIASFPSLEQFTQGIRDNIKQAAMALTIEPLQFEAGAQAITQNKTVNLNMNLTTPDYDRESTRRWIRNIFLPEFRDILKNMGIEL